MIQSGHVKWEEKYHTSRSWDIITDSKWNTKYWTATLTDKELGFPSTLVEAQLKVHINVIINIYSCLFLQVFLMNFASLNEEGRMQRLAFALGMSVS